MLIAVKCYCGSMAEQLIRNEQVVSSILTSSSKKGQVRIVPVLFCCVENRLYPAALKNRFFIGEFCYKM